jgi:hypothetical protein
MTKNRIRFDRDINSSSKTSQYKLEDQGFWTANEYNSQIGRLNTKYPENCCLKRNGRERDRGFGLLFRLPLGRGPLELITCTINEAEDQHRLPTLRMEPGTGLHCWILGKPNRVLMMENK